MKSDPCPGETPTMKNKPFYVRMGYALAGIRAVFASEPSFRTEIVLALAGLAVMILLRPGWIWCALVMLAIAIVLAFEMLNSALEYLIDRVHPEFAVEIGKAKDAASGAVLIASFGAVAVGVTMILSVIWPS